MTKFIKITNGSWTGYVNIDHIAVIEPTPGGTMMIRIVGIGDNNFYSTDMNMEGISYQITYPPVRTDG